MELKFARVMIATTLVGFLSSSVLGQSGGWQADSHLVQQSEEQQPDVIWRESSVPGYQLPHPLRVDGSELVHTKEEWLEGRAAVLEQFRFHMYGRRPGLPDDLSFEVVEEDPSAMGGAATLRRIKIQSRHEDRSHAFELILFLPNEVEGTVPVFLLINNRGIEVTDPTRQRQSGFWPAEEVIERGYGIAAIQYGDLAPDNADCYQEGVIRLFEGEVAAGERAPDAWKALAAWGWGASRAMDYFETDPRVDASKVAVLGHSRGGKAALWAGAEDERFALVISNESGAGGAALSSRRFGETIEAVNRFSHWFADNFTAFNDAEEALPFDQHQLLSLMAPRALYVASADQDLWADPRGEFLALSHASPVYALWGHDLIPIGGMPPLDQPLVAGPRGYHVRSGGHDLTAWDWHRFLDFADGLQWRQDS